MSDSATRAPAAAARAELAAAGITVTAAGAAAARRRRLDVATAHPPARNRVVRRRVRSTMRAEQPPGDAARHPAA